MHAVPREGRPVAALKMRLTFGMESWQAIGLEPRDPNLKEELR